MIVALAGGVGGAKLALGLQAAAGSDLLVVANTGDDFVHLGLHVAPDVDTLVYTLAGRANAETGWGVAGETWDFMDALAALGGETWFRLGDRDLATHVERTRRLAAGETLGAVTRDFCARLGVAARVVPMSDDPVRTVVETDRGTLAFQHYFVRDRCAPRVRALRYEGAEAARPAAEALAALADAALEAVVVCPSNPFLSIAPMLAMPDLRAALAAAPAPLVAVSPIIAGAAVKGPAAKIMTELGRTPSAAAVAAFYDGLIDGFVLDRADAALAGEIAVETLAAETMMRNNEDKARLAEEVLAFARGLQPRRRAAAE